MANSRDLAPAFPAALPVDVSRRGFILTSAAVAGGFMVGCAPATKAGEAIKFGDFVRISGDGTVTVVAKVLEMGQGTHTGLAAIVAEELDADWLKVKTEPAPANPLKYYNTFFGKGFMLVGGSTGISNSWAQLRDAGAAARSMLVDAAAELWKVPASQITVAKGIVSHANGKTATFGDLAEAASRQKAPQKPTLKDPSKFTLIGKQDLRRQDSLAKTTGATNFTIDVKPEGCRSAVIARPPKFGAKVKSFDAVAALKIPGVLKVAQVKSGVAVIGENHWAASKGRDALSIVWDYAEAETRSTADLFAMYKEKASKPGTFSVEKRGDAAAGLASAAKVIEAVFEFPFLAHATMEPMNAVAKVSGLGAEIWTGSQAQTFDLINTATAAGVLPTNIKINMLPSGGSFGRRAVPDSDFVVDAVYCAKAMKDGLPVSMQWSREDDIMAGRYRPMTVHHVKVGLDANGKIVAWQQSVISQSIMAGTPVASKDKADSSIIEGIAESPMIKAVPNLDVTASHGEIGVPVLWWRSVGHTHTAYVLEHMLELCAKEAGVDSVAYRRTVYKDSPRHLAALNLAVEKSGYPARLPAGRAYGVAVHESFKSVVAQIAEVSIVEGVPKVHKVTVGFDCGIAVLPDQVRAQSEGGLGYGLGAVLYSQITLKDGEVEQKNFDTYETLRMADMPIVETHIVPSNNAPSGVGEPGTPVIGPAVANAVLKLTGKPTFKLPFKQA
jgi:isoquinoline 1-oxidoreductase beta subunit